MAARRLSLVGPHIRKSRDQRNWKGAERHFWDHQARRLLSKIEDSSERRRTAELPRIHNSEVSAARPCNLMMRR
jgi:hypothetical protein